jgi:rod shape-determining protein MreD
MVCFIQIAIMPYLSIGLAVGNLILVALIIFLFRKEYLKAVSWAFFGGFFMDISLGIGLGPYLVSFLGILIILYFLQEKIFSENLYIFAIATIFLSSIIFDIFFIVLAKMIGQEIALSVFWTLILKQAVYNTVLLAIIYPIYYYLQKKLFLQSEIKLPKN